MASSYSLLNENSKQKLTLDQIKRKRALADAMMGRGFSATPVSAGGSYTPFAGVADALRSVVGQYQGQRQSAELDKQQAGLEAASQQEMSRLQDEAFFSDEPETPLIVREPPGSAESAVLGAMSNRAQEQPMAQPPSDPQGQPLPEPVTQPVTPMPGPDAIAPLPVAQAANPMHQELATALTQAVPGLGQTSAPAVSGLPAPGPVAPASDPKPQLMAALAGQASAPTQAQVAPAPVVQNLVKALTPQAPTLPLGEGQPLAPGQRGKRRGIWSDLSKPEKALLKEYSQRDPEGFMKLFGNALNKRETEGDDKELRVFDSMLDKAGVTDPAQRQQEWLKFTGRRGGGVVVNTGNLTEGQGKAVSFGMRAEEANKNATEIEGRSQEPGSVLQRVKDMLGPVGNMINSDDAQLHNQAKREFINTAILRQDSGAAIADSEYDKYNKAYFPEVGDGPANIKRKQEARERAVKGLEVIGGERGKAAKEKVLGAKPAAAKKLPPPSGTINGHDVPSAFSAANKAIREGASAATVKARMLKSGFTEKMIQDHLEGQ